MDEQLSALLIEYRRAAKLSAVELHLLRVQAVQVVEAGGTVSLIHEAGRGFRIELTLPKRRKVTKVKPQ